MLYGKLRHETTLIYVGFVAFLFAQVERLEKMDEEKKGEEVREKSEEQNEESSEDNREEETKDEIRDEVYVNDDEIEMLRSIEKRFDALEEKLDNAISMMVDSGAMVQDVIDEPIENEDKYEEDFINIDALDLAL